MIGNMYLGELRVKKGRYKGPIKLIRAAVECITVNNCIYLFNKSHIYLFYDNY